MSQVTKISRNNTRVIYEVDRVRVVLHQTEIVTVWPDKITLNTGGWNTPTTRTRMNQVSNEMGLGYQVSMRGGGFSVFHHGEDHEIEFHTYTFNR